jgi:hypothetical protein
MAGDAQKKELFDVFRASADLRRRFWSQADIRRAALAELVYEETA